MHDDFGSGIARGGRGRVGGAIVDNENAIEPLARPADNFSDMFFFEVSGNGRRDRGAIDRRLG